MTNTTSTIDWAKELTTDMGGDGTFPFVEDENCNVTGYGHQPLDEFAAALNRYDELGHGQPLPEEDLYTADDIAHRWAVVTDLDSDWRLRPVAEGTPDAIAVTTVWGQR